MNKKGFTLIELLAVIIIISLLTILVLPKITDSVRNYNKKTDALMLEMIEDAAKLYIDDNPDKFIKENGNNYCVLLSDLVNEDYLKGTIEYNGEDITNTKGLRIKYNNGFEYKLTTLYKGSCTLANYITNLYKETTTTTVNEIEYSLDETHLLINDRLGNKAVEKTDGNIRYYGANPNNYIDIGDRDSEGNIIFWRIIGLFKDIEVTNEAGNVIKTEDLVKIIRADKLTSGDVNDFSWDYTSTGDYDNNWNDSTLQVMLNDEVNGYYASGTTSYYNNSPTPITLDFSSTGLSIGARTKAERVKWNLGTDNTLNIYVDAMYRYEKSSTNVWSGKIALMYPSDYGYSANLIKCAHTIFNYNAAECTSTNWLLNKEWQWLLTPWSKTSSYVINSPGRITTVSSSEINSVRPVLYLKSDVGIIEEKKTEEGLKYYIVG